MPTSYDQVRYVGFPFAQTHPDRLATIATMFGMQPPPVASCRVLELGCGDGANLIPLAAELPGTHFVGIDLAATAIDEGRAAISELGLTNIELFARDLMEVGPDLGAFDYIIAHGLYSWVPPAVQQKSLEIASRNLAPSGVAYISYNAYPGAKLRSIVRDIMLYHISQTPDAKDPVEEGREFLQFIVNSIGEADDNRRAIKHEAEDTLERSAYVVFHDELSEAFSPVYFHDFVGRAASVGLQYLGEAGFQDMQIRRFPPEVASMLDQLCGDDRIRREQYMDFLKCRKFRQTLLCHANIQLKEDADTSPVHTMYAASSAHQTGVSELAIGDPPVEYHGPHGSSLKTSHPVVKTVMARLTSVWPESVHFDELQREVREQMGPRFNPAELPEILLATFRAGIVELRVHPTLCKRHAGERPQVSAVSRWQARTNRTVTTLRHTSVDATGATERHLLTLLDGTRDRKQLVQEILPDITPPKSPEEIARDLERNLDMLGRFGMLLA